jgi:hypothetical protein
MRLTLHAEKQRAARKIDLDEIRQTMRAPERARLSRDEAFIFTKHVSGRRVKVVFTFAEDGDTLVITVGDEKARPCETRAIVVGDIVLAAAAVSTRARKGFDESAVSHSDGRSIRPASTMAIIK